MPMIKAIDFPNKSTSPTVIFPMGTLMEEIELVVTEKHEFQNRENSTLILISHFQEYQEVDSRRKMTRILSKSSSANYHP